MQEAGRNDLARLGVELARAQIPVISQDNSPLLAIDRDRILRRRMGHAIQSRVDSRYDEKKTDDQEDKSL